MKFTVQKSDFLNALTPAMGTVSNKNTIASIEGVLMETMPDGTIRISTYDMNKGIRAVFTPISVEREGKFIVNAQRLYQTVRVMPEDELTVDIGASCNCTLSCVTSTLTMFAMRGEDFPNMPELLTERGVTVPSGILRKMITKTIHSVADQDNRPMLCGTFFKISPSGITAVSCDSFTLSICRETCEIGSLGSSGETEFSFILPGHALPELLKIIPEKEEDLVNIYLSRKHAIFRGENIIFFTRTIDSEYIDYERIIPKDLNVTVTVDRERLLAGLERANIIAEEKIQGSGRSYVKLNIEDQSLHLTSVSVNGKVYDEMDCVHEGEDLEIGFNCRYLINSIKAAEGDNIIIRMKSPTQAITVEPAEEEETFSYFYMILPVRMNQAG